MPKDNHTLHALNNGLNISPQDYSLLTDLYQLTMAACYVGEGLDQTTASFELFVRKLPRNFHYLIAMGLAQAVDYLTNWHFTPEHISQLQATGIFAGAPDRFWHILATGKFTGDLWAVPEGTAIFPHEPILRITAPLWQAQIVETYLLTVINYQTLIATKAARIRHQAGPDAAILEFGTRRAFTPQASLWAARAAIAAGFNSTSNVLAALQLGQKPAGTMAHALVMAIGALAGSEDEAFAAFSRYFPQAPLLIDTYDPLRAAQRLAQKVEQQDFSLTGIRLDSGDLVSLSTAIKSLIPGINIFASGDLDEYEIHRLQQGQAAIDGYGIGTKLVTGSPVNGVYKLVNIDGIATMKRSQAKATYPGEKQIFRAYDQGMMVGDRLGLATEAPRANEQSLLQPVITHGKLTQQLLDLSTIQRTTAATLQALPAYLTSLEPQTKVYPFTISPDLDHLRQQVEDRLDEQANL
jgi:nicotinate phosphoribosyltransferase